MRQSAGAKTAPDNAFSDQQALKLLQRLSETLNSLVELEKQGKSARKLLEQRLALVQRRADINSKQLKRLHRENLRLTALLRRPAPAG